MFFFSLRPLLWTVTFILIIIFLFAMFSIALIGRTDDEVDGVKIKWDNAAQSCIVEILVLNGSCLELLSRHVSPSLLYSELR